MYTKAFSAAINGISPIKVEVECYVGPGRKNESGGVDDTLTVVGLPDAAVRESRERVKAALRSSRLRFPSGAITVSLAPADVKKSGAALDLPIAIAMANCDSEEIHTQTLKHCLLVGELALDGTLRPLRGALAMSLLAREQGFKKIVLPMENAKEAAFAEGVEVYGVNNLHECYELLCGRLKQQPVHIDVKAIFQQGLEDCFSDFRHVKGHRMVKRGLEVAAAGGHNLLMLGPPGCGKTLLARSYPGILPRLTLDEALKVTQIHSISGSLPSTTPLITQRPYRAPHHTVSDAGLLGGTSNPRPGEVSLAHHGVLFLDELPEFRRNTLEVMRQPLESGEVVISRAMGTATFPARFMLLAAMNPCPCGYFGSRQRNCRCGQNEITRYRSRISGPLLDRIDIHLEVGALSQEELMNKPEGEPSVNIRQRVEIARNRQYKRLGEGRTNSELKPEEVIEYCALSPACREQMQTSVKELNLSARAYDRILRLARTIADLDDAQEIATQHLGEAIQYRTLDRNIW